MNVVDAENNCPLFLLDNLINDKNSGIVSLKEEEEVKFREIIKKILIESRKVSRNRK